MQEMWFINAKTRGQVATSKNETHHGKKGSAHPKNGQIQGQKGSMHAKKEQNEQEGVNASKKGQFRASWGPVGVHVSKKGTHGGQKG